MIEQIQQHEKTIRETLNKKRIWDLSDSVLYDMCRDHPSHTDPQEIIMKTLIIGRVYSVQLERNKRENRPLGDEFYEKEVITTFRDMGLDDRLSKLRSKDFTPEVFTEVFQVHKFLMNTILKITDMDKRSFCSKYLHFHFPNLFFLYDSRLRQSVSILKGEISKEQREQFLLNTSEVDIEYVKFFLKCFNLKNELETFLNRPLTIREFDTVMIELSNYIEDKKRQGKSENGKN
jgi:hypothetical protein